MKRLTVLVLAVALLAGFAGRQAVAQDKGDFQAVKKAVKENPNITPGQEAKWFKILVQDANTKKDTVRVTLPISLVEVFVRCAQNKHVKMNEHDLDLDIGEVFAELKKLGPLALIEVYEKDQIVKIWLE